MATTSPVAMAKYVFSIRAETMIGETVILVGDTKALGNWDVKHGIELVTSNTSYPVWYTSKPIKFPVEQISSLSSLEQHEAQINKIEFKFAKKTVAGDYVWEQDGGFCKNRWVTLEPATLRIHNGDFDQVLKWPMSYVEIPEEPVMEKPTTPFGKTVVVFGSSVAAGFNSWKLQGWAYRLKRALQQKYGHAVINLSEPGSNVARAIQRFDSEVVPLKPDFVVISLSLGNEGLFHCAPHDRNAITAKFLGGMDRLVQMVQEAGAIPIVTGIYPNGDTNENEHGHFISMAESHFQKRYKHRVHWLSQLADGNSGRWKEDVYTDHAHPNTEGHRIMFEQVDLELFDPKQTVAAAFGGRLTSSHDDFKSTKQKADASAKTVSNPSTPEHLMFSILDGDFEIRYIVNGEEDKELSSLVISNRTSETINLNPRWNDYVRAMRSHSSNLTPGIYIADVASMLSCAIFSISIGESRILDIASMDIPPMSEITFLPANKVLFAPGSTDVLFYDGKISVIVQHEAPDCVCVTNETETEYNIHPMWTEVRKAMSSVPSGSYEIIRLKDTNHLPDFSTLIIGPDGLQSRVKIPPKSSSVFRFAGDLEKVHRVALVPIGSRCAMRMLLHHLQYDGPCYPFDLTRTSNLSDVTDIIYSGFGGMWNPHELSYSFEEGRIYHSRWSGLSYAHEVEEGDDPVNNAWAVFDRMGARYAKRAERFDYVMNNAPQVFFLRTGYASRDEVLDYMGKLAHKYQRNDFKLIMFNREPTHEYQGIENVIHFQHEMDPDRMNEDPGYRNHCAHMLKHLINNQGVNSNNLFWCPSSPHSKASNVHAPGTLKNVISSEMLHLKPISSQVQIDRWLASCHTASNADDIFTPVTLPTRGSSVNASFDLEQVPEKVTALSPTSCSLGGKTGVSLS
eukprot:CAMPEP_0184707908 /NCGR_PEP_ID=MMETSP0313-20130426/37503_1 /TAXON_ID=2792 /ORGANISM="Porphyridium aerugineum, Strain SAG 1380-2" /LENGTH=904 /DNA_ID=CAMNT_0027169489 /DNA_START=52 /DNA_END=2766 /DNA_ORIENTATION=-